MKKTNGKPESQKKGTSRIMKRKAAKATSLYRPQAEMTADGPLRPDRYDKAAESREWFDLFPKAVDPTVEIAPAYKPKPGENVPESGTLFCHCPEVGLVSLIGLDPDISDLFQMQNFTESCATCLKKKGFDMTAFQALFRFGERDCGALFETGLAWGLETISVDFYRSCFKEGSVSIRKVGQVIYPCSKPSDKDEVNLFGYMPYQSLDEFIAANAGTSRASEVGPLLRERLDLSTEPLE